MQEDKRGYQQPQAIGTAEELIGQGKTLVKTQVGHQTAIAVQVPRDFKKFVQAVTDEAMMAGKAFYYSFPVKSKDKDTGAITRSTIEGGSIGMAMALIRNYGNAAVEIEVAAEDSLTTTFRASVVDMEKGVTIPRLFRYKKTPGKKRGGFDEDRTADADFQIAQSKAMRNAVLKFMPEWLLDTLMDACQSSELKAIERMGVVPAREQMVKVCKGMGVTIPSLLSALEKDKLEDIGAIDLVHVKGMVQAIRDKQATVAELFPPVEAETPSEKTTEKPAEPAAPADSASTAPPQESGASEPPQAGPEPQPGGDDSPPTTEPPAWEQKYIGLVETYGDGPVKAALKKWYPKFDQLPATDDARRGPVNTIAAALAKETKK